jgi:NitT/TauT family transport system substrate-binding protein
VNRIVRIIVLLALVLPGRAWAAPEKIKVGVSPALSSAGLFLAKERGYFAREGLDVELVEFPASGPELIPALATGQLDVGAGNISARMYNAMGRGVSLRIVADKGRNARHCGYLAIVVGKGLTSIHGPADLRGRRFALTGPGVSQEIVLDRYLGRVGLSIKDVKIVYMSYQDANAALISGAIDGTVQIEPLLTQVLRRGDARVLADADDVYPDQQSAVVLFSEPFAAHRRAAAVRFLAAYLHGVRDYRAAFVTRTMKGAALDTLVRQLSKWLPVKDPGLFRQMRPVGLDPNGALDVKSMRADLLWYYNHGYVKEMPDLKRFVDPSYAAAAARQ